MEKVIIRGGQEGQLIYDDKKQTVSVRVGNVTHLVTYMRDGKIKVKNDILLNSVDLARVRTYMQKFIKKEDTKAKKGNKRK